MSRITLFFRTAFQNIRADVWLNLASVLVISLMITLVSAFLTVAKNGSMLLDHFAGRVEVVFYLAESHTVDEAQVLAEELRKDPAVAEVTYISKAQALARFKSQITELADVVDTLEDNPLPASVEISLHSQYREIPNVERFAEHYTSAPGVEEVYYGKEWVKRLGRIVRWLWIAGAAVGLFLAGAALFIIANTIKLSIHRRAEEIALMRLVGATNRFIQAPFLIVGVLQGLLGTALSMGVLYGVFAWAADKMATTPELFAPFFPGFSLSFLSANQILATILGGALLGLFGSLSSTRKFLRV